VFVEEFNPEEISLFNMYGQKVAFEKRAMLNGTQLTLEALAKGVYFIETTKDQVKQKTQIIKE
jgi:hypothetical protein